MPLDSRPTPAVDKVAAAGERRDPWLTEREAAKELRVSLTTVRAEREAGRLGHARVRTRVFYPLSLIAAYKAKITCLASDSGSTPTIGDGTSPGQSTVGRIALQRAREIVEKQKRSARHSS